MAFYLLNNVRIHLMRVQPVWRVTGGLAAVGRHFETATVYHGYGGCWKRSWRSETTTMVASDDCEG